MVLTSNRSADLTSLKKLIFNSYIKLVPHTKVKMSDCECPICYEPITKSSGVTTLGCSHSYHVKCYATWGLENNTCPCCRRIGGTDENLTNLILEDENLTVNYDDGFSYTYDMIDEAIDQLRDGNMNMTLTQFIRTASGRWINDSLIPDLQLPPHIERHIYPGHFPAGHFPAGHFPAGHFPAFREISSHAPLLPLNANAESFVPFELRNAATRITAVAKGFLVRRHQTHEQINTAAQSLMTISH